MSYGVQDDGTFERKPVDEIRDDIKQDFLNELGQDIELRPSSPVIQIINAVSLELTKQWAAVEDSYYSSFFEDSFGEALDKQLALAGFQRLQLRGATGEATFKRQNPATQDIVIPEGTVIQAPSTNTRPKIPFQTTDRAVINKGNTEVTNVPIEALEPWETDVDELWLGEETNLSPGVITEFGDPLGGVDSVTNPTATGTGKAEYDEGRDEETDAELKNRYISSFADAGDATADSVNARVFNADPDIKSVDIEEVHDTNADDYGVRVTVHAPNVTDDTIAQAIFDSRAAGLESFGSTSGTAVDDDGQTHTEQFDRASGVDVEIEIGLTTDSSFPSDGQTQIEDRLVRYIGGQDNDGNLFPGLGIGEDVIYDQVFRRIINQDGVVELTLEIAKTGGTLDKDNINVQAQEAAETSIADITFI
jgi:hypothetical protein